jgi:hypothetical protein
MQEENLLEITKRAKYRRMAKQAWASYNNYISILNLSSIALIGLDVLRMLVSKSGKLFSIFTVD